mmetsp:Transcript_175268/g.562133  ORF Transcript_175268/g.562133 Transcript_175268/m.562133 type:complete len:508 (+) Transcript_175268:151-1674(+)
MMSLPLPPAGPPEPRDDDTWSPSSSSSPCLPADDRLPLLGVSSVAAADAAAAQGLRREGPGGTPQQGDEAPDVEHQLPRRGTSASQWRFSTGLLAVSLATVAVVSMAFLLQRSQTLRGSREVGVRGFKQAWNSANLQYGPAEGTVSGPAFNAPEDDSEAWRLGHYTEEPSDATGSTSTINYEALAAKLLDDTGTVSSASLTAPGDRVSDADDGGADVDRTTEPWTWTSTTTPTPLPTLFCFVLVIKDTREPELMKVFLNKGIGIFACDNFTVLADEDLVLGSLPDGQPVPVEAVPGDKAWMANIPGSTQKVWHNTNIFLRAWYRIQQDGVYRHADWTVKVDPDSVFLPQRLQRLLLERYYPWGGASNSKWLDPTKPMYLANCLEFHSLQGPLEVFSRAAATKFFGGLRTCEKALTDWKTWGEDWFVHHCMQKLEVKKAEGYGLLNDMWCHDQYLNTGHTYWEECQANGPTCKDLDAAVWHPYKSPEMVETCLRQALEVETGRALAET